MIRFTAVPSAFKRGVVNVTCHACRGYIGTVLPERAEGLHLEHVDADHPGGTVFVGRRRSWAPVIWEERPC